MLDKSMFPQSLQIDLDIAFGDAIKPMTNSDYRRLIEIVPTTSDAKKEVFYGDKGRLRRWRGERQPTSFHEYVQTLTLDEWEMTFTPKRSVLTDDQSGGKLRELVTNFATEMETSREFETWDFFRKGCSRLGFDKCNFFSTAHVWTDSTGATFGTAQSNYQRGGSQLDATTLQVDMQTIGAWTTDQGKPLGARVTDVIVKRGSLNAKNAKELANSTFTVEVSTSKGANTYNVFKGGFNVIEVDYGLGATEWAEVDLSDPMRKPIKVLSSTSDAGFDTLDFQQLVDGSENAFWRNEFAFGVRGKFDWNPGYWYTAYLHGASDYVTSESDLERQRVAYPNSW